MIDWSIIIRTTESLRAREQPGKDKRPIQRRDKETDKEKLINYTKILRGDQIWEKKGGGKLIRAQPLNYKATLHQNDPNYRPQVLWRHWGIR